MKATEYAWAAGFSVGEGTIYVTSAPRVTGRRGGRLLLMRAAIAQADPQGKRLLLKFQKIVGSGHLYGPYQQRSGQTPYYRLDFPRLDLPLLRASTWKYLSAMKRKQWLTAKRRSIR